MTKLKYTPGPWKQHGCEVRSGQIIVARTVYGNSKFDNLEERESNARAIAALPEVMQTLTKLVALQAETTNCVWGTNPSAEQDLRKRWADTWNRARAIVNAETA
jgi:hypothetical protein